MPCARRLHPRRSPAARRVHREAACPVAALRGGLPAAHVLHLLGLNTQLNMVMRRPALLLAALAIPAACSPARASPGWAAARLTGENNRDAMAIGAPARTRTRADGADQQQHRPAAGVIQPGLFAILVLMAILTTPGGDAAVQPGGARGRHRRRSRTQDLSEPRACWATIWNSLLPTPVRGVQRFAVLVRCPRRKVWRRRMC